MIHTGLAGGSSAVTKEQSWSLRRVHSAGLVKTGVTTYLHMVDPHASEERWAKLLALLNFPKSALVLYEDDGAVHIDLKGLVIQPGYTGIKCIVGAPRAPKAYLVVYDDCHIELSANDRLVQLEIRRTAASLQLLAMN